jgi:hypothetical protein
MARQGPQIRDQRHNVRAVAGGPRRRSHGVTNHREMPHGFSRDEATG